MIMEQAVRIMMATYNGQKYLREQLDSIINQTYENWSLIVQDDGSNDDTWLILKDYSNKDKRIEIRKSSEQKHGAYYNFHSIANQEKKSGVTYDYYMFSDQDDIWDSGKIEEMLFWFIENKIDKPQFLYGDMKIIDANKKIVIKSIAREQGLFYKNVASLFICHNIYGCNTMMNKLAFMSVPIIDTSQEIISILCHDNLYAKFSGVLGEVNYMDKVLMSYRRHGENVTSIQQYGFGLKRIIKRLSKIDKLARDHARTYKQSLYTITLLKNDKQGKTSDLNSIEKCICGSGFFAVRLFILNKIDCGNMIKNISRCVVLFSGKHKKYL